MLRMTPAYLLLSFMLVGCLGTKSKNLDKATYVESPSIPEKKLSAEVDSLTKKLGSVPAINTELAVIAEIKKMEDLDVVRDETFNKKLAELKDLQKLIAITNHKNFYYTYPRIIRGLRKEIFAFKQLKKSDMALKEKLIEQEKLLVEVGDILLEKAKPAAELALKELNDFEALKVVNHTKLALLKKNVKNTEKVVSGILSTQAEYSIELQIQKMANAKGKVSFIGKALVSSINWINARFIELQARNRYEVTIPRMIKQFSIEGEASGDLGMYFEVLADLRKEYSTLASKYIAEEQKNLEDLRSELESLRRCQEGCNAFADGPEAAHSRIEELDKKLIPEQEEKIEGMEQRLEYYTNPNTRFNIEEV